MHSAASAVQEAIMSNNHKSQLLAMLLAQHGTEQRVWSGLSEQQKQAIGKVDDWSAKDHIVHVSYWREVYTQRLRSAVSGGEVPAPDPDYLQTNDAVFEEHKEDDWKAVINWARQVQGELIEAVEAIDEQWMESAEKFEWTNNRPLWQHIAFGEGYHPYAHLCEVLLINSDFEAAESMQLDLYEALCALDESEDWQGNQRYNLACFYALHDHPERAIELLEESFAMNAALIDWSKQDSDLDALREMSEFQALYPLEV
jgi:hypothetical protein